MFKKNKGLNKASIEELEQILLLKRREARQNRFLRLSDQGISADSALLTPVNTSSAHTTSLTSSFLTSSPIEMTKSRKIRELALLVVEIGAVIGLVIILINSYLNLQTLNSEVVEAQKVNLANQDAFQQPLSVASTAPDLETLPFSRLPGGHSSPTNETGAIPDVPLHLQNWVQPSPAIPLPEQSTETATRIVIPKINVDAPIIQGVSWEDLKKGVGHLPNSAQPGERGNLYLAAHNDIYGEIFRYLEDLEPGDQYHIYAGEAKYTYVVREKRIIEPTEVSVMLPTTEPVATLQTCYPYLIDTHRLVVISDLLN